MSTMAGPGGVGLAAALAACLLAGCVAAPAKRAGTARTPEQLALDRIEPGRSTLADVEAAAGQPDYFMPSRNVAVYIDGPSAAVQPPVAGCARPLYVAQYRDDVLVALKLGFAYGDLVPWGGDGWPEWWADAPEIAAKVLDESVLEKLQPGVSRRAEVEAFLGEPYYVLPRHDVATYVRRRAAPRADDDVDACGPGDADCVERIVITARRRKTGLCTLGVGLRLGPASFGELVSPGNLELRLVQYDGAGRVARIETAPGGLASFRLDRWAGGAGAGSADDEETAELLAQARESLDAALPDACDAILPPVQDSPDAEPTDGQASARPPGRLEMLRCLAALRSAGSLKAAGGEAR